MTLIGNLGNGGGPLGAKLGGGVYARKATSAEAAAGVDDAAYMTAAGVRSAMTASNAKTLVILGSSNASGVGASTWTADPVAPYTSEPATSWVGRLRGFLTDWAIYNRSVSGMGSTAALAKFWTDVAPYRPSHVVFAVSLHNDSYDLPTYAANCQKFIQLCDMIGAIPIIRGPSPYNAASSAQIVAMQDCTRMLETLGVPLIDAMSALESTASPCTFTGSGATYHAGDGLHCNDAGYAQQFYSIYRPMFDYTGSRVATAKAPGTWKLPDLADAAPGMTVTTAHGLPSFTMRQRVGGVASGAGLAGSGVGRAFMAALIYASGALRVRNFTSSFLELTTGSVGALSALRVDNSTNVVDMVMVVRNAIDGSGNANASFFLNGVLVGSPFIHSATQVASSFIFGSREAAGGGSAGGYRFADCQLWNVPLNADAIADMARTNTPPRAGMVFDSVLAGQPRNLGSVPNLMSNGLRGALGITWNTAATM